jgi:membrane protein
MSGDTTVGAMELEVKLSWYRDRKFFRKVAVGVWRGLGKNDSAGMAAAVAYHFIFSFFAGFFFLACVATQFGRSQENIEWILGILKNFLPPQGIRLAEENIGRFLAPVSSQALPFALILSLWTASNVVEMLMKALNRIYSVAETRPLWQTRLWSLLLVSLVALFFVVAFNLVLFGDEIRSYLALVFEARGSLAGVMGALQFPLVFGTSAVAALLIYFMAPNFHHVSRRVALPGALLFAVGWHLVNWGFDQYVTNFADFDRVYGPLGTAMAVLMWVYLSALILLIGGELNAQIAKLLPKKHRAEAVSVIPMPAPPRAVNSD